MLYYNEQKGQLMVKRLSTYDDWRHCITIDCGLALTPAFVRGRLTELRDTAAWDTQRFVKTWGEEHRQRVIAWFERAERELAQAQNSPSDALHG